MGRPSNKVKAAQAKRESGGFWPLPFAVGRSRTRRLLTPHECKLWLDLIDQYNLSNNGALCCAWTLMHEQYGWKSRDTLFKAQRGLQDKGWIVQTRQGGMHQPNLFALTIYAIDECPGKGLEIGPTRTPTGEWKRNEPVMPLVSRRIAQHADRVDSSKKRRNQHADRVDSVGDHPNQHADRVVQGGFPP